MKNMFLPIQFRIARKQRNLKEVSDATGISVSFLSEIELGKTAPSVETLVKLCDYYQVPVSDIFCVMGAKP